MSGQRRKVLLSWSSGKDSAWSLHVLREQEDLEVVGLLSTVQADGGRVVMHDVAEVLLEAQAAAAGLPLQKVRIPNPCPNALYQIAMSAALKEAGREGVDAIAFGDLFLEDVRRYRERALAGTGFEPLFPLWARDTRELAAEMIAGGLAARITAVDPRLLAPSFAGRAFDERFLAELPPEVDPLGERGEFHTFAWAGPMFAQPVRVRPGEVTRREGFVYADLVPAGDGPA